MQQSEERDWGSAWQQAMKVSIAAAETGFDWPDLAGVIDKLNEESCELKEALAENKEGHIREELGDVCFTLVNIFRKSGLSPEEILSAATAKFCSRFERMNAQVAHSEQKFSELSPAEMNAAWDSIKDNHR